MYDGNALTKKEIFSKDVGEWWAEAESVRWLRGEDLEIAEFILKHAWLGFDKDKHMHNTASLDTDSNRDTGYS